MAIQSTVAIPNQLNLDWKYCVVTYFTYDSVNYISHVSMSLYKDAATSDGDQSVSTKPALQFSLCLDPNYPFQHIRKQKPNLTIVAEHEEPQNPDHITQAELTALRSNFDGYILSEQEVGQLFTGDTTALLYTYGMQFLNENFGVSLNDMTVV